MELTAGQRLSTTEFGGYTVGACLSQTPWHRVYAARKMFVNYRYAEREFYETDEDEWLDVLMRAAPDAPSPVAKRTPKLLKYEAEEVLGKPGGGWFPQPIDLLELELSNGQLRPVRTRSPRDRRSAYGPGSTIHRLLVMSRASGRPLGEARQSGTIDPPQALHVAAEILDLLTVLHERGQVIGGFAPDDFLIDQTGRWTCLASDRVLPSDRVGELRPCFPPERYPAGFSPPEALDPGGELHPASDIYSWAALCLFLLTGHELKAPTAGQESKFDEKTFERLEQALTEVAEREADLLTSMTAPGYRRSPAAMVLGWGETLVRCLSNARKERPADVDELRLTAAKRAGNYSLKRLWRRVAGAK